MTNADQLDPGPADPSKTDQPLFRPQLAAAVLIAGAVVLGLITISAGLTLAAQLDQHWRGLSTPLGPIWIAAVVAVAVVAVAGLIWTVAWAGTRGRSARAVLLLGLCLTLVLRLVAIAIVHPDLISDWLTYHQLAISISHSGGPLFSYVPTGYPILLAAPYAIFGPHRLLGEGLNLAFALWTAAMLFVLVRHRFGLQAAAPAVYLFAIFPSQVLMTTVLGTEVTYGAFVATAVTAAVIGGSRGTRWVVLTGLVLGLSQYVRSTTVVLLPAFVALIWFQHQSAWKAAARSALLVATVMVVLLPAVAGNIAAGAGPSVATSRYGGWSLLIGLNTKTNGQYNKSDIQLVGLPATTIAWEKRATELALQRLTASPTTTAALFVRKFPIFWGADDYGATWTALPPGSFSHPIGRFELLVSQIVYTLTLALALIGVIRWHRKVHPTELLIVMLVCSVAVLHTLVEVQTRYHSYLIPLFCVLAGGEMVAIVGQPVPGSGWLLQLAKRAGARRQRSASA